jgi:hypothetical protein
MEYDEILYYFFIVIIILSCSSIIFFYISLFRLAFFYIGRCDGVKESPMKILDDIFLKFELLFCIEPRSRKHKKICKLSRNLEFNRIINLMNSNYSEIKSCSNGVDDIPFPYPPYSQQKGI